MKRTTITWPEEIAEAAEREARRRHTSVSAVVREAVAKELQCEPGKPKRYSIIGLFHGPKKWVATDLDAELNRTWAADIRRHQDP